MIKMTRLMVDRKGYILIPTAFLNYRWKMNDYVYFGLNDNEIYIKLIK